jgi:hypothetical protein
VGYLIQNRKRLIGLYTNTVEIRSVSPPLEKLLGNILDKVIQSCGKKSVLGGCILLQGRVCIASSSWFVTPLLVISKM